MKIHLIHYYKLTKKVFLKIQIKFTFDNGKIIILNLFTSAIKKNSNQI